MGDVVRASDALRLLRPHGLLGAQHRGRHARELDDLNAGIYHCWPWVEIPKAAIGFYRPKNVQPRTDDDRYLSIRIYIEQDPSPAFGNMPFGARAAAMFSRYVGPLLKR